MSTPLATRLTLLTRTGCHLCGPARRALDRVTGATGVAWAEVDVDTDDELAAEYGERLPVVLLDGVVHSWFRADEAGLLRDLTG